MRSATNSMDQMSPWTYTSNWSIMEATRPIGKSWQYKIDDIGINLFGWSEQGSHARNETKPTPRVFGGILFDIQDYKKNHFHKHRFEPEEWLTCVQFL